MYCQATTVVERPNVEEGRPQTNRADECDASCDEPGTPRRMPQPPGGHRHARPQHRRAQAGDYRDVSTRYGSRDAGRPVEQGETEPGPCGEQVAERRGEPI